MRPYFYLLQADLSSAWQHALLCFITALVISLLCIPVIILFINRFKLYDQPNGRKLHTSPVPTMGGVAIAAGMLFAYYMWIPFDWQVMDICFLFCVIALLALGMMDDLLDLPARYKFLVQVSLAALIALSGIRIHSFEGLFGIHELPLPAQYSFTILAIVGITNAFNLIDGIDGLAGSLAFMSLLTLGIFLTLSGNTTAGFIAFALAGAILGFLYFNFNPAKIFMGDTGSLVIGFIIAVLGIQLMQSNAKMPDPVLPHSPLFVLGIVLIPVFDTLRVFATRIWKGKSPFTADKTHIHHFFINAGFSHSFTVRMICFTHAIILTEIYLLQGIRQELVITLSFLFMLLVTVLFKHIRVIKPVYHKLHKLLQAE